MLLKVLLILLQVPPLIMLLVAMAIVSLVVLNNSVNDWTGTIQTHVLTEEREHIVALADNVALFTQRRFARMTSDMLVVRDYAQRLVANDLVVTNPYQSYHFDVAVDPATAPTDNRLASNWFRLGDTVAANQPFLDNSSALDNVWRVLPGLYQASGLGLESDGFFRAFPFSRSTTLSTMSSLCHSTNTMVTGFNPRCREWYTGAKANATTSGVFYTPPYTDALDPNGAVVISSSAAIWDPIDPTKLFGVVFNDIQFRDLELFYRGNKILDNGFPFLLDDTTAQLLYYPGMSRGSPQYFRTLHFGSETSAESTAFSTAFNASATQAKTTSQTVSFSYTRSGKTWQGSVSAVNGTSYLVGVVVPESDIRKPVDDVISRAKTALVVALIVIIIVIAVMLVASIILNSFFSDGITIAVYSLVGLTERFAEGDYSENKEDVPSTIYEVRNIQDSFRQLALAVQFSNPEYFKDDTAKALAVSLDVEKMLTASKNHRGLGAVQNNIALYVRGMDEGVNKYTDSCVIPYLEKSVQSGQQAALQFFSEFWNTEVVSRSGTENAEHRSLEIAVLNRQLNLLAVRVSVDAAAYTEIQDKAKSHQDASGEIAAFLRFAEALELKDRQGDALNQRQSAVRRAIEILTRRLKLKAQGESLKDACEAVFDAALQMALLREGGESFESQDKVHSMYQHLNLALMASALLECSGMARHSQTKKAQKLLAHVLAQRGENSASTAMIDGLSLEMDSEKDLKPVKPGMSVTVENLLSGDAQEVDGFYNTDAVAGNFGADVKYDEYGNPIGSSNELAQDGAFEGMRILVGIFHKKLSDDINAVVIPELAKKGFAVDMTVSETDFIQKLDPAVYSVAWIVSEYKSSLTDKGKSLMVDKTRAFHEAGRGLMIWGDNDPFYAQANMVLEPIFNMRLTGNTPGRHELTPGDGFEKGTFSRNHLLATGILKIYEGVTICYPEYNEGGKWQLAERDNWTRLGTSSDGFAVLVARDAPDLMTGPGRVVVDNGFTKMYQRYWVTAGNARYVSNCAAWLSLCERPQNRGNFVDYGPCCNRAAKQAKDGAAADPKPELHTLRTMMAIRFGSAYGIFILLVFIVCLVVSLTTTERVKNDLRDALQDQVQRQATSLMKGVASAFGEDLATASESGTTMIGQATADVFRTTPAYCLAPRTSYYDLGATTSADFKQPTEFHLGFTSSLQASSLYVPGVTGGASTLNASVNATVDLTSNLDPFFASIYGQKKDEYFNLAAGFAQNSLFRRMPAIDTNNFDTSRSYNPTTRSWYTSASASYASIYTTPYRDFNTKRWMISVSSAARGNTTGVVGVATVDILLATLVDSIRNLRVLDSGKITLVDHASGSTTSATVVADQEWIMADTDATIFTLDTLTKPAVSAEMQSFITQTSLAAEASNTRSATFSTTYAGETGSQSVMVIPTRLSGFGDRYYFTAFVKESEVFAAFEPLLADIKNVNTMLSVVLVIVWAAACVVAALAIFLASMLVAGPIVKIEGNVQRMVENVGSPDLTKGCEDIDSAPYDSAAKLAKNFNAMVQTMRESATQAASPLAVGSQNGGEPSWMKSVPSFDSSNAVPAEAVELGELFHGRIGTASETSSEDDVSEEEDDLQGPQQAEESHEPVVV